MDQMDPVDWQRAAKRRVCEGSLDAQAERRLSGLYGPRGGAAATTKLAFPSGYPGTGESSRCSVRRSSSHGGVIGSCSGSTTTPLRWQIEAGRCRRLSVSSGVRSLAAKDPLYFGDDGRAIERVAVVVVFVLRCGFGARRSWCAGLVHCLLARANNRLSQDRQAGSVPPRVPPSPSRARCSAAEGPWVIFREQPRVNSHECRRARLVDAQGSRRGGGRAGRRPVRTPKPKAVLAELVTNGIDGRGELQ